MSLLAVRTVAGRLFPLAGRAAMSSSHVTVTSPAPFVSHVALDRPDKRNALNEQFWKEIGSVFRQLSEDKDCRVIVLSGNGPVFCSGIDLADLAKIGALVNSDEDVSYKAKMLYKTVKTFQDYFTEIEKCSKPVICAIHNACVGAGVDMVVSTDIRMCSKDAWFQVKEVDMGLAADVGTLQRLPKVIGSQSLVNDLCLTCRKMDSQEAEKCGFVSKVLPDKESLLNAAFDMATSIAAKSPVAVQGTKHHIVYGRDHTVEQGLEYIARWNSTMLQSSDLMKIGMAMMTKSKEPIQFSKL